MKEKKTKNYKARAKNLKFFGLFSILLTTLGGVSVYEFFLKGNSEVEQDLATSFQFFLDNIYVKKETMQLNFFLAFPMLAGVIIWLVIVLKKNKKYFSDKMSLGMLICILVFYLIYSLIGLILSSLIGAFVGVINYEFIIEPQINKSLILEKEEKEVSLEVRKEYARQKARKKLIEEDFDGTI